MPLEGFRDAEACSPHPEGGIEVGQGRPDSFPTFFFLPVVIPSFSPLVENSTCRSHSPYIVFHVKLLSVPWQLEKSEHANPPRGLKGQESTFPHVLPMTLPGQGFSTHSPEELLPLLSCAHSATTLTCTKCSHQHFSALPEVGRLHRMLSSYLS